ncbi:MAG: cytochrome c [Vicinamibacterales bacterium]
MGVRVSHRIWMVLTVGVCAVVWLGAQEPAGGRGGRGGAPPAGSQAPAVPQIPRSPVVDQPAHDRGRALWASHCIDCHGSQARGSDTGPNIIRSRTANFDRTAVQAGSVLGPFLKAGHPTQSQKPSASFTDAEVADLAQFIRQKINDTMRGAPSFTAGDVLVGDVKAGEAYFKGEGACATCHSATTRNLAGVATRIPEPVDLQQRMLFPGGGGRGRRGAAPPVAAPVVPGAPAPAVATMTITRPSGPSITGVVVEQSDFYITLRDAQGTVQVVRRTPALKITMNNPLQAHIDLLDRISDTQIHDLVAYLETMK